MMFSGLQSSERTTQYKGDGLWHTMGLILYVQIVLDSDNYLVYLCSVSMLSKLPST